MTMNTELKTELKEIRIDITNAGKGKAKYFFDFDYAIRGEESRTLYECEHGRIYLSHYDALLNDRWDSEYDIRPIFEAILKKIKIKGHDEGISHLTLTVSVGNVSKESFIGLSDKFKCPVTVLRTTLERLVFKRKEEN